MIRVHLCQSLSTKLLNSLINALIEGANSYLARLAINSDAVIYFDRQAMLKFEKEHEDNDLVKAALADLRTSRYRIVPFNEPDDVSYLRTQWDMIFFLAESPSDKPYIVTPDPANFVSSRIMELCAKGEISMRWSKHTANEIITFLKFVTSLKSQINRIVVAEREPKFDSCEILKHLMEINPDEFTCYYRNTGEYASPSSTKIAPYRSEKRTFRGVSESQLIHERCIWVHDAFFRIDNATDSICGQNHTWTMNFSIDKFELSKTEGKFKCPSQYMPQRIYTQAGRR